MLDKEQIFRKLYDNRTQRDMYIESVPSDICAAIFDNGYTSSLLDDNEMMIEAIFDEHSQAISWFLNEWMPGYEVGCNGKTSAIHNIDEYIVWMKDNEGFA